jgi:gliding motility-associated-like protein
MKKFLSTLLFSCFSVIIYSQSLTADIGVNGTPSDSVALCGIGDETTLTVDVSGGTLPYTYLWSGAPGQLSPVNDQITTFTPYSLGLFNVVCLVTDFTGDFVTDTIHIIVNPKPSLSVPLNQKICIGNCINLTCYTDSMYGLIWYQDYVGGTILTGTSTDTSFTINVCPSITTDYWALAYDATTGCIITKKVIVTVNPLPIPIITGPNIVCEGSTGNIYSTQSGMANYVWTVSAGGTITAGGTSTSNTITITWNTAGTQTVSVNYKNSFGCSAVTPTIYNVTVNPLSIPTITGASSVCIGSTGNIYTTQAGMTGYVWTVSAGGTITAGGTSSDNTVTINWNTAGTQTVSVNYTNSFGCSVDTPVDYNVTVNPLPTPTITGPDPVCVGTSGNIYITESGMTDYVWTVSAGGAITAGGTSSDSSITVTWNTIGAQTVIVNYTNLNGCTAITPLVYNVTVNPVPTPTITGPDSMCAGTAGNIYSTEAGMANYIWTLSAGGTITAGGTSSDNTVTITWNTAGTQTVSVNYSNSFGCPAASPVVYNVTVYPIPVPTITGPASICEGTTDDLYTTESGMINYVWTISAGGTITAGGTSSDNTITVTWNTLGSQTISVNYTNSSGCPADTATVYNVTINPLPVPSITGPDTVCAGIAGNIYITEAGMMNYTWTVSAGGTITAGGTSADNSVSVAWNTAGTQLVTINYANSFGCAASDSMLITVMAKPIANAGNDTIVCAGVCITIGGSPTASGGTPAYTYNWNPSTGLDFANIANPLACFASTTTYTVTVTDSFGCAATDNVVLSISPTLTANISPIVQPSICGVCDGIMTVTASGGVPSYSYSWNTTPQQTTQTISSLCVGLYYVTVTDANGCSVQTNAIMNNSSTPPITITASPNDTVCAGECVTFAATASFVNYDFLINNIIVQSGSSDTLYNVCNLNNGDIITVEGTDALGCSGIANPIIIGINPLPFAYNITGGGTICSNDSILIGLDSSQTGVTYNLLFNGTPPPVGNAIGTGSQIVFGYYSAPGTYTAQSIDDATGCTNAMIGNAIINTNPLSVPTIAGPNSICIGTTGNIYVTESGMTGYVWTVSAGGTITSGGTSSDTSVTVTWNTAGAQTVSVNYTNSFGCSVTTATVYNVTVNQLPVPTLSGQNSVCVGTTGNIYITESGMTGYIWTVSSGGAITAGGTSVDTSVTVTWNATGAQMVSVNYTNTNGCTDTIVTVYNVTVNPLPVPTITGPSPLCAGITGNIYITESGMSGYVWTVSAGGTITAGGTSADTSVTVTWNTSGAQTVSVNYTNIFGCSATSAIIYNVTVNPLPVPTITGPSPLCEGTAGNIYTTESGMTGYVWTVSAGGTITAGGTSADTSVTVTWNIADAQTVSVNYTNSFGCTAIAATVYNVTVNPLPVPTIAGPNSVCIGTTGNIYVTESGMSGYVWTVSAGGTITAGGTSADTSVTVTWNTAGAQTVSVNYINSFGCTATSTTIYNVTINPLPVPTITGPSPVCAGITGNIYTTESGMSGYVWTVSAGGSITAGGTSTDNTVTITWNTVGSETISVNYINTNGCTANTATIFNITVNPIPTPTITGPSPLCAGTIGNIYTTEAGMTDYVWTVSPGGTITAGGTSADTSVTVTWNTAGAQTVTVNYTNSFGCTATAATVYNVTVNPLPVPTIAGPNSVCIGTTGNIYVTESGMSGYVWTLSAGGNTTAGGTSADTSVTITWNTAGAQTVSVNYTNSFGCTATMATVYNVIVNPLPVPTITGPSPVCAGTIGNIYSTESGMTAYSWTVSAGGTITAGGTSTSSTITITWNTVGAQTVSVNYTNANGCTANAATVYNITVNPLPAIYTVTGGGHYCAGSTGVPVGLNNSQTGVNYQLQLGGVNTGVPVAGTGAAITFGNQTAAGTYTVIATNTSTSCTNTMTGSAIIIIDSVTIGFTPAIPVICSGQSLLLCASGGDTYLWNGGEATSCILVSPINTTTYSVTVNDLTSGCSNSGSVAVIVNTVNKSISSTADTICEGNSSVFTASGGGTYIWNTTPSETDSVITVSPDITTNYCVTITSTNGCSASLCETIYVNPLPGFFLSSANTSSCAACDGSVAVIDDGTATIGSYLWSNGMATSSIIDLCPDNYSVTVTTLNGCEKTDSVTVLSIDAIGEITIVNTFSPNDDGINDKWEIKNIDLYPDNELIVVNRWGNEVYSVKGYQNNWDGNNLSEGTYFYFLKVKMCDEDNTYKGYITIVR